MIDLIESDPRRSNLTVCSNIPNVYHLIGSPRNAADCLASIFAQPPATNLLFVNTVTSTDRSYGRGIDRETPFADSVSLGDVSFA